MTDYTAHEHPFSDGEIVRHKAKDKLVRLEYINPDPYFDVTDEIWAEGQSLDGMSSIELDGPHEIEPYKWNEATLEKITGELSGRLHSGFGGNLEVSETELDGEQVLVTAYWDGVPVKFDVTVVGLEVGL